MTINLNHIFKNDYQVHNSWPSIAVSHLVAGMQTTQCAGSVPTQQVDHLRHLNERSSSFEYSFVLQECNGWFVLDFAFQ